jgi:hypothetical protein
MNFKLLCLTLFVIESQLITSLHCGVVLLLHGVSFMIMLGSKENSHCFFSYIKNTLTVTFTKINLQYKFT